MDISAHAQLLNEIREHAVPLMGAAADFSKLFQLIDNARFVLIGEATHGTEEFYRIRAKLTKYLIQHFGFAGVAVEADWPDAWRANQYVRGQLGYASADPALDGFTRFPTWMWRNAAVAEFLEWLRDYNDNRAAPRDKAGFYGLDLYSLHASVASVIDYLNKTDPQAALRARHYYNCFTRPGLESPQNYGYAAAAGLARSCEEDVVMQLAALQRQKADYLAQDGFAAEEAFFCAEQNAKVAASAEAYYRKMFFGRAASWNLRDSHMVETLYSLAGHLSKQRGEEARLVVWAHNSHVGDARATELGQAGEHNIGQLVRQREGGRAVLVGFSTYHGTVTAASEWNGEAERKIIQPALPESYESLFHETGMKDFMLILRDNTELSRRLNISRLQRAIGVIYAPETERQSHYFFSKLPEQFDALIHINTTHALKPLDSTPLWHRGEVFETYPTGL
ncbi:MAG TPA: erythromycin esterase family protein [Alphaproteobacteria bacterium]|nr:erythromycin esterase family protein [Alphaproteobacteria bacterium]